MMRKICPFVLVFLFFFGNAHAQELLVRHDRYYTEIFLKLDTKTIRSIDKKNGAVTIYFSKKIKSPFEKLFKDKFIKSVSASGNTFTVNLYPDADVSIVNDPAGIKIAASAKKTNADVFSSYGIGEPLLSSENSAKEDQTQKEALDRVDRFITEKKFADAAKLLNDILATTKNDFYRQEALYRLGQTFMLLSQVNDVYLAEAYNTFDNFARLYPDNFRTSDVLLKSAEAKEKANQLFEAIISYQKIYDSVPDLDAKRRALAKIADLYRTLGQYDKAVSAYQKYIDNFRTGADAVLSEMGQIYFDLKDTDTAFEYFSQLDIDKIANDSATTVKRLFSIARTMEERKKFDIALKLYKALYEKYPDAKEANDAIFKSADILRTTKRDNEADMLLLKLKTQYPDRQTGQKAAVEYAKKYLNTKPSDYWKDYFKDMLSRDDTFSLQADAKYLIIKAMSAENNIDNVIAAIDSFLGTYPGSQYFKELDKIREDFTLSKGNKAFLDKDYAGAENILRKFEADYPESVYKPKSDAILGDIRFSQAMNLYTSNKFKDAATEAEKFIAEAGSPAGIGRWLELLDNASYKYIDTAYSLKDYSAARTNAKQYLTNFPNGRNATRVIQILENSINTDMMKDYDSGNFQMVTGLYENDADWIRKIKNATMKNKLISVAGLSAYKLGAKEGAKKLYASLVPDSNAYYVLLGVLTGDKNLKQDPNSFDNPTFRYLIDEVKGGDPEYALKLVKQYTKDPKLSAQLEYSLAKTSPSDVARQSILSDVYDVIKGNENARFDGSADVYLDMGALYFNKNDFKSAVLPLKQFIDEYKTLDDKRAEALYYMGKSFASMNDSERGFQYFNEIINTIPNSVYAGIAKSEMDENMWKRGVMR